MLWLTTIFFFTPEDMRNTGLEQFAFIRTPASRKYGNMVWINGPASRRLTGASTRDGEWWWWKMGGQTRWQAKYSRDTSQQSWRKDTNAPGVDNAIHLNIITTVVVEDNTETVADTMRSAGTSNSGKRIDEDVPKDRLPDFETT